MNGDYEAELTDNETLEILAQVHEITEWHSFLEGAVQRDGTRSHQSQAGLKL